MTANPGHKLVFEDASIQIVQGDHPILLRCELPPVPGEPTALPRLIIAIIAAVFCTGATVYAFSRMVADGFDHFRISISFAVPAYIAWMFVTDYLLDYRGRRLTLSLTQRRLRATSRAGFAWTSSKWRTADVRFFAVLQPIEQDKDNPQAILMVQAWRSELTPVAVMRPADALAVANAFADACNTLPQRAASSRPVRVNEWFGQIPEDTEQPPTSKATVERHDDAITIDLGRAPRRRKLSGFTVIGVIFTVFGALIMALSTEIDSSFPGKVFFSSLAVTLLGLAVLAVMWMKGRTRTVVDIAPDGIVFTYLGMLRVRQESFAHDDIVSIEAIAEGERNLSCLAVQLRSGRTRRRLHARDELELAWIAATMRDTLRSAG